MHHSPFAEAMRRSRSIILGFLLALLGALGIALAQFGRRPPVPRAGEPVDRGNVPNWDVDPAFRGDLFTFARIRYRSTFERQSLSWYTDFPDADLNLSFRLHQLTALNVNPEPKLIQLGDDALFDYPWAFMSGVGNIVVDDHEAEVLRTYLERGGFLFVDDFWGDREWGQFYRAIKQVFPNREPEDLPRSHPIFHCLYDIPDDRPLQTPNIRAAIASRTTGRTWEGGEDGRTPHFRAIFDDRRRMMVMICHNMDTGDGWEEEGTDKWFFHTFGENKCYPLAFNIVVYAMTH